MRRSVLIMAMMLVLAGCESRPEVVAWRGHPSVVLCPNQGSMLAHVPNMTFFWGQDGWRIIHGAYDVQTDTVYLLCSDANQRLSIPQAFYLVHELQHAADAKHDGDMWQILQDESSPNGYLMGGYDFDPHHHEPRSKPPFLTSGK